MPAANGTPRYDRIASRSGRSLWAPTSFTTSRPGISVPAGGRVRKECPARLELRLSPRSATDRQEVAGAEPGEGARVLQALEAPGEPQGRLGRAREERDREIIVAIAHGLQARV